MTNIEIRSMEVRAVDDDKREVTGIAVPYGQVTDRVGYLERFDKGSVEAFDGAIKLYDRHQEIIGQVIDGEDTDEGFVITARISKTTRGNDVYEMLRDGTMDKFSVGFIPVEDRMDGDVLVRTKVKVHEVSVVDLPAYAGAQVLAVREGVAVAKDSVSTATENNNEKGDIHMSENTIHTIEVASVEDLRATVADMERRMAVLADRDDAAVSAPQFRSGGDFLKALASGDKEARDFATTVEAGVVNASWVGGAQRLLDENRNTLNLFTKAALPASGNSVEFPAMLATGTGTVGRQVAEGDLLPYMEVSVDTATAPVYTYGGYSSLSRQAIERSDIGYLELVLRYQTLQYAKATNKVVRDTLVAGATAGGTLAADDAGAWIELVSDTADDISNVTGYAADFIVVSSDVFMRLAKLADTTGRPVFVVNGDGQNTWGNVNIKGRTASIAGIPVVVDSGLAANSAFVANANAITVFESAGAPFRLQDEDILRLTKDFSLYGYMAVGATAPAAAVKVDVDLVA